MASIKDLKKRIGTVKNTQQTTRAMKMVSAAKLRRAQDAIQNQRPYAKRLNQLINLMTSLATKPVESPLLKRERELEDGAKKRLALVIVTSDRGLCGAFNSSVNKTAMRFVAENEDKYESIELMFLGRKGYEFFKNRKVGTLGTHFQEQGGKVSFAKAKALSDLLIESYVSGHVDEVQFLFNEFVNAVTQRPAFLKYLPLETKSKDETVQASEADATMYIVKPSYEVVLQELLAKNFNVQTFRVMLESQAGEHGARMSSMENATKNAGEMIKKLSLQYNKQRQAGITKELLEIIAGSESAKG